MRTWLVLLVMFTVPAASAGSAPVLGFLADGDSPADPGVFMLEMPAGNESSSRPVIMDLAGSPTAFVGGEEVRAGTHLRGPMFAALWIDASAVESGSLQLRILSGSEVLGEQSIDVTFDPESLPEPESLVPGDPSDPEGAIYHIAAQVLPAVMQPPMVFNFGTIDMEVPEGDIRFELSLLPAEGDLLAAGSTLIKYDAKTAPSYLYLPWWSADPAAESPQKEIFQSGGGSGPPGGTPVGGDGGDGAGGDGDGGDGDDGGGDKGSPSVGLVALVAVLGALVLRRRS